MSVLLKNEKAVVEVKKHPFYFYTQSLGLFILAIAPLVVFEIFTAVTSWSYIPLEVTSFLVFTYTLFLAIILIFFYISWTDYFVDVWIITDSRIIDFELKGLFHKDVASVRLDDVQDVKVIVTGIIESWLKIGNLYVQTAGLEREFVIKGICDPERMKLVIMETIESHRNARQL